MISSHPLAILRRSLCLLFLCMGPFCVPSARADSEANVRVGIYDLPPLAFVDNQGQPQGLFVELLDRIAVEEGWHLEYVPANMSDLQVLAIEGKLDLLAPFAFTEERTMRFDYPEQSILLDWGVIVRPARSNLETLLDLQGKEIAVVRGSIFTVELEHHLNQFHVAARLVELGSDREVAAAVAAGRYPAGACANIRAQLLEDEYAIARTSILFAPLHFSYAAGTGHRPHLLKTINRHLAEFKNNPQSVYYQLSEKWLPQQHLHTARYIGWGVALLTALLILARISLNLRRQVKSKIAELVAVNDELESNREELNRLNQQFQALLDGIPDQLMLISPAMRIIWMNQAARHHTNSRENSLAPQSCYGEWAHEPAPCRDCPVRDCFESGQTQETVMQQGERIFGVKAFPVRNEQGEVESVVKLAIDISDKIRLREENNRQNRLAAVGTLAAGVAHEVNNPAGLILSNLELINEAFEDAAPILDAQFKADGDFSFGGLPFTRMREQLPALLMETGDAARRIRQTVEDLKDFARGGGQHEVNAFPLRDAVERSVRLTDHLLRKAAGHITLSLAEEPILLLGNKRRIEQVLINLLANACQALPERNGEIRLSTHFDAARQIATIDVHDDGAGIPAEHLPKLATPFFTTRLKEGGTGLGLSVSFGIVKEHGGTIHFTSEPGRGTTVTVSLPASITEFN